MIMSKRATLLGLFLFTLFGLTQAQPVAAQVSTDGTLGVAQTLIGPDYQVTSTLAQQIGNNLYHSFDDFNINAGESVTFSGPASVQNIVFRVTGGMTTNIDGLFRTTIPGANIYLLDPDGIQIGPNTTVDISGDLYFAATDGVVFSDNVVFLSVPQIGEVLTAAAPDAFRHIDATGAVIVTGPLLFAPGALGLIGNGVGLASTILDTSISGSNLLLASVNSPGELSLSGEIRSGFPTFQDMGLGGTATISSGAGDIDIIARDFNHSFGTAVRSTGIGSISIRAAGNVNFGSVLTTSTTLGTLNLSVGGDINLSTGQLAVGTIDGMAAGDFNAGAGALFDVSAGSMAAGGFDVDAGAMFNLGINSSVDFAQLRVIGGASSTIDFNGTLIVDPPATVPTGTRFELISNDGPGTINGTPIVQTPPGRFATTIDNDLVVQVLGTPGVSLSPTAGNQVSETGTTTTINLVLDGVPRGEVTLGYTLDNTEAEIVSAPATIQPEDWDVPQPIVIRGLSDGFTDGDQIWNLVATVTTATDVDFDGLMDSVTVTTLDGDHVPDAFSFVDQVDIPLNTLSTSNPITVSGIDAATTIGVTGGQYAIDGGPFTAADGLVNSGQTVVLQQTSSANFSTTTDTVLQIGTVTDTFSVTTFDEDPTPDAFSFTDQTDVELSTLTTSNTIMVSGINTTTAISVLGGEYSIDGGPFTAVDGMVTAGQMVSLQQTSSADFSTTTDTVLDIGGVIGTFSVTTRDADQTPDAFSFTDQTDVELSTLITSDAITVSGIEIAVPISVTGGEYAIDGGPFTAADGTVSEGQSVTLQQTSSADFSTTTDTLLDIGGVMDTFSVTTLAEDLIPDAFNFPQQFDILPNTTVTSAQVTISGINSDAPVSIIGGEYSINGAPFTAADGIVNNADAIAVRLTVGNALGAVFTATLTVGGVSADFSVMTIQPTIPEDVPILNRWGLLIMLVLTLMAGARMMKRGKLG